LLFIFIIITILLFLLKKYCAGGVNTVFSDLSNKTIVITGGTSGMGLVLMDSIAKHSTNTTTIVTCSRNGEVAESVLKGLREQYPKVTFDYIHMDLADLESVKKSAQEINQKYSHIDILINNAGVMRTPFGSTKQGFETQMGVNYLSHLLLVQILKENIKGCNGRVINLSSIASELYRKREIPLTATSDNYRPWIYYFGSKLAMAIMAKQLSKENIFAYSLHPGCVRTALWRNVPLMKLFEPIAYICFKSPLEGIQTALYLVNEDENKLENGGYYADCKLKRPNKLLLDQQVCDNLWNESMEVINKYLN